MADPYELFKSKAPWIIDRLMADLPWRLDDAAACVGNAGHESGGFKFMQEIKPVVPGSAGGYGWFQWTGPRRRAYEAWCTQKGLVPSSDEANYGFLLYELKGTEKAAVAKTSQAVGLYSKVVAFELGFERAGVKHYDSRYKYAQIALDAHAAANRSPQHQPVPPAPPTAPEDDEPGSMDWNDPPTTNWLASLVAAILSIFKKPSP